MDQSGSATASTSPLPKRQQRSIKQKRDIVEETLARGASVARVARVHGVNANQVFAWRRLYRQGRLGSVRQAAVPLLPVAVSDAAGPVIEAPPACHEPGLGASSAVIELELSKGHLRIEGSADPAIVRVLLECLLG